MPNTILHKRGTTAPLAANLTAGELAINTTTGDLYTKTSGGVVTKIGPTAAGSGTVTRGTTAIDFGAFPGKSDASVAVAQPSVTAGTIVKAWLYPVATADHSADEHLVETLNIFAGAVSAGVGFTIYGVNRAQQGDSRIYGLWTVAWEY